MLNIRYWVILYRDINLVEIGFSNGLIVWQHQAINKNNVDNLPKEFWILSWKWFYRNCWRYQFKNEFENYSIRLFPYLLVVNT